MSKGKITLLIVGVIIALLGLIMLLGGFDIFYTKTIGSAKENARREVFEQTQSYVEGKRQEATKYRLEYLQAKDSADKTAIKMTIVQSFANFDVSKLEDPILEDFVNDMKYNK